MQTASPRRPSHVPFKPPFRQPPRAAQPLTITFEVDPAIAPALRSAIDEISNEVGGRLEGPHRFAKEDALTRAARALGVLRAAIAAVVPSGDPDYV